MKDPLDTWKAKEEDAIIARSEERESTWPGVCPKCHYATDHCLCGKASAKCKHDLFADTCPYCEAAQLRAVVDQCEKALLPFECETCNGTKLFTFECQGCLTGEAECTCDKQQPEPCPQCQWIDGIKAMYAARDEALAAIKQVKEGK